MANATAITLNDLVANQSLADPTPDTLDTGTAPVTLPAALKSAFDRFIVRVKNLAAEALTVTVESGDSPPAFRAGLGDYTPSTIAQNAVLWLGPFESARFAQDDGDLEITFTPGGTINAQVTGFRLPVV